MHNARLPSALATAAMVSMAGFASADPVGFDSPEVELTVNGGEINNGLSSYGGYYEYFDKNLNDETTWSVEPLLVFPGNSPAPVRLTNGSSGGFGSPVLDNGSAVNSGSVNGIAVTGSTTLDGTVARSTFTFSSDTSLDGHTFVFYTENDIAGVTDSATFTGSIAGGNLSLFQYNDQDNQGTFVRLAPGASTNAELTLFGSDRWTGFGNALEAGDLSVLSADGSNFETTGDLGLALAWELSGTSASVSVTYNTQGAIPEPTTLALAGLTGLGLLRRRR